MLGPPHQPAGGHTLDTATPGVYDGGMAKIQLYLPDSIYRQVKRTGLPASLICRHALLAELAHMDGEARRFAHAAIEREQWLATHKVPQ